MRIMFVGDINLGEYYTSFGHGPRTFLQGNDIFKNVKPIFEQADIVVGNLEAPLTNSNFSGNDPESMVLRGDPRHAEILRNAGFKVLQVANNHTVQHGKEGFHETVETIEGSDIKAVGLKGQDPVIFTFDGQTVGFIAASDVPDNTDKYQQCYQAFDSEFEERVIKAIPKVDHLFVLLHWGLEASTSALPYQMSYIEKLYKAGVRGVIGAHPHLFYEVWKKDNFVAAPSLGNFVFDLGWDSRLLKSGILDVTLKENELSLQVWPIALKENGCLPTKSSSPFTVDKRVTLYNLGDDMSGEQFRKTIYFIRNIFKGNLTLKLNFFIKKIKSVLS